MAKNDNIVGAMFELDISDLKNSFKEAKQNIDLMTSEFKKSTAGLNNWQKSTESLSRYINTLTYNMEQQEIRIASLKEQYRRVALEQGENSEEAKKLLIQINKEEAAYEKMGRQLTDTSNKLKKLQKTQEAAENSLLEVNETSKKATEQFKKTTKSMIDWENNTEGLKAKIKQLNKIIPEQSKAVNDLEQQYKDLVKSENYSEESAKGLKDEYQRQKKVLDSLTSDVSKYSKQLDDANADTKKFDSTMSSLSRTITSGAKKAFAGLVATATGYVTSLVAVSESTREYRQDLSKLESNSRSAGVSLELTKEELKKLNAITGETDSNIEALSNLMMAGFKDNNLQEAVDTLSNAVIKFPDTLKVESLADSLQESIKQMEMGNNATGQYAELLERLGYNLEEVTEKTNKKKTLEEKQAYLLDLVNSKIGGTTEAYREQNSELVGAADAQFELNDAMSQLGEKAEPSISLVKNEVANLIKELLGWIDTNVNLEEVTADVINEVKSLASTYLPPLIKGGKIVLSVGKELLPLIIATGGAILTYNTYVKTASILTKTYGIVTSTLKAGQLLLTGATIAQTKAQLGMNAAMAANPVGLVVAGVAALTIGIVALVKKQNEEITKAKEVTKAVEEQKQSYDDLVEAKQNEINAGLTEMEHSQDLWNELKNITDENGKIKKGYEARAKFITSTLSSALGIEIEITDGVIKKYGELEKKIQDVILAKKAEIILSAQEELYKEAILKRQDTLIQYNDTAAKISKLEGERAELEQERRLAMTLGDKILVAQKIRNKDKEIAETDKQYDTLEDLLEEYNYNIANYETNATYVHNKEYDKVEAKNWEMVKNYKDTTKAKIKEIEDQIKAEKTNLELLKKNKSKYDKDTYNSMVKAGEDKIKALENELNGYKSTVETKTPEVVQKYNDLMAKSLQQFTDKKVTFKQVGDNQIQAYIDGVAYKKPVAVEDAKQLSDDILAELNMESKAKTQGENTAKGLGNGIEAEGNKRGSGSVWSKVKKFGANVLGWLATTLALGSPSKETKKYGKWLVQGLEIGIGKEENSLLNQVKSLGNNVLNSFNSELGAGLNQVKGTLQTQLDVSNSNASNNKHGSTVVNNFYQTNNSPEPLSNLEIYRQTKNILSMSR